MRRIGDHAVVLGASVAGLLAARVLVEAYERVTVVERDPLPDAAENRRGVPQGRHAHVLMARGAQILDELFPGLLDDPAAGGAPVVRDLAEMRFSPGGHPLYLEGRPAQAATYQASRPYLEGQLRARVRALPTVEIVDRCEVVGLVATAARDRVTGVRILRGADGVEETLGADLILDATGRGGRTAAWLATIGYDQPPQEQLTIQLKYATRHLRLRPDALPGHKFIAIGAEPGRPTGFVLFAEEQDRWILTVIGYGRHHPTTDPEGFLAFVETVARPMSWPRSAMPSRSTTSSPTRSRPTSAAGTSGCAASRPGCWSSVTRSAAPTRRTPWACRWPRSRRQPCRTRWQVVAVTWPGGSSGPPPGRSTWPGN
jgi:2-polyprenyl-6-methoxyphenol hydroxylase-like FAD-dependent oxidoreductase